MREQNNIIKLNYRIEWDKKVGWNKRMGLNKKNKKIREIKE